MVAAREARRLRPTVGTQLRTLVRTSEAARIFHGSGIEVARSLVPTRDRERQLLDVQRGERRGGRRRRDGSPMARLRLKRGTGGPIHRQLVRADSWRVV